MWALNLMKYREWAEYADGRETNLTGVEADDVYLPHDHLAPSALESFFSLRCCTTCAGTIPMGSDRHRSVSRQGGDDRDECIQGLPGR